MFTVCDVNQNYVTAHEIHPDKIDESEIYFSVATRLLFVGFIQHLCGKPIKIVETSSLRPPGGVFQTWTCPCRFVLFGNFSTFAGIFGICPSPFALRLLTKPTSNISDKVRYIVRTCPQEMEAPPLPRGPKVQKIRDCERD